MTRIRLFLHGAAAIAATFGICSQQQLKAQDTAVPVGHVVRVGQVDVIPADGFDAAAGLYQGPVIVGANPPSAGPPPTWPCTGGGGDAPCTSIPLDGFVIPFPKQVVTPTFEGEIVWTFTTTSAAGTADFKVTITQGTATLFSDTFNFAVTANGTWYAYLYDVKLTGATKGVATVTVATTVGTATITGKTALHIQ